MTKQKRHIEPGNNWVKLEPGFLTHLLGKCEYMVADVILSDGKYFLDRYFIRNKVHVEYPDGGNYKQPNYPHCVLYRIRFKKSDELKVREALDTMYKQSPLMDFGMEYQKAAAFFQKILAAGQ